MHIPATDMPIELPARRVERLTYEEYKEIQRIIVQYIRTREAILQTDEDRFAVRQEDIVGQVHANYRHEMLLEDKDKITLIANAVISRMIKKEKVLRIVEDAHDNMARMLALHPDFLDDSL